MEQHLIEVYYQLKQEMQQEKERQKMNELSNIAGVGATALESAKNLDYNARQLYNTNWGGQGQGIAAEVGNNEIDKLLGHEVEHVGGSNVKDRADRIVDGQEIQTKYYNTANGSVDSAFKDGQYRYFDKNGKPMQLEVPKDQYDKAVKRMEERISKGEVPGVTDLKEAKNLVRKGHLTHEQAVNMTKFGTKESFAFDMVQGVKSGVTTGGISAGVSVVQGVIREDDKKTIAINAAKAGGKAAIQTTATSVITNQAMRSTLGKVANKNVVTAVVATSVLTAGDVYKSFTGKQSFKQTGKNLAKNGAGVGGGMAGAVAGAAVGSVIPVVGTCIGGLIGGAIGATLAAKATDEVMTNWLNIKDDVDEMISLLDVAFQEIQEVYQLDDIEGEMFKEVIRQSDLKTITQAFIKEADKEVFCLNLVEPLSIEMVYNRMNMAFINPKDFYEVFKYERLA